MFAHAGPRGGMVDTGDLKSLGLMAVPVRVRLWVPLTITMHIFLRIRHISFYKKSLLVAFLLPNFSPIEPSVFILFLIL